MKHCAYCEQPILGTAVPVADDAGTGAHAPAYWHADRSECGPRARRVTTDDRPTSVRRRVTRTGRRAP